MRIEGNTLIDDDIIGIPLEIDLNSLYGIEVDHDFRYPKVKITYYGGAAYRHFDFYDEMKEWVKEFKRLVNGYYKTQGRT